VRLLKEGQVTKRDGTQITLHFATPELAKLFKDSMTAMGNKDVWFTTKNGYTIAGNLLVTVFAQVQMAISVV